MHRSSETDYVLGSSITSKQRTPAFVYAVTLLSAIGGFLFGYDTGVVSGAMLILRGFFGLNEVWQELIVSVTIAGAWVFSLIGGPLSDKLGRKSVIIVASFVFAGGSVLMGLSQSKVPLLIGRFIVGAGIGLSSMVNPIYIAEVAPSEIRGRLVTVNNVCITFGQFVASLVAGAFSGDTENGWRFMLGLAGIPAAIQFVGFLFMPESPRWLIQRNRYQEAVSTLRVIRGPAADTEEEFEAIKNNCIEAERENQARGSSSVIWRVLQNPTMRRALIVGCLLQIFQQISGINTVMYYSATIIEMSGVRDHSKAIWLAAATAAVNTTCSLIGLYFVEKVGRRLLTLVSLAGVIVSLLILALGFHLTALNSPDVLFHSNTSANSTDCDTLSTCTSCTDNPLCGFCFDDMGSTHDPRYNSSCLPTTKDHSDYSNWGSCAKSNGTDHIVDSNYIWAYEWCPSTYSWIILIGLFLYLFFFAPGMGPMPWTINSEIYPLWARSTCYSVATSCNWFFNLFVSMTFLTFTTIMTKYGTFYMYTGLALLGWIIFYLLLPETRGRTLEEVESLFSHPWWQDATTIADRKIVQYGSTDPSSTPALHSHQDASESAPIVKELHDQCS